MFRRNHYISLVVSRSTDSLTGITHMGWPFFSCTFSLFFSFFYFSILFCFHLFLVAFLFSPLSFLFFFMFLYPFDFLKYFNFLSFFKYFERWKTNALLVVGACCGSRPCGDVSEGSSSSLLGLNYFTGSHGAKLGTHRGLRAIPR